MKKSRKTQDAVVRLLFFKKQAVSLTGRRRGRRGRRRRRRRRRRRTERGGGEEQKREEEQQKKKKNMTSRPRKNLYLLVCIAVQLNVFSPTFHSPQTLSEQLNCIHINIPSHQLLCF
jgi:hypothetical protein